MTKTYTDYSDIDINEFLEQRRLIGIIWGTGDLLEIRPDLNDDQAWEVLQRCDQEHDCTVGIAWEFIECVADEMFPAPSEVHSE